MRRTTALAVHQELTVPYDPPSCPAGSEQIDPDQIWGWNSVEDLEDALGDWGWLLAWVPRGVQALPFRLGDLCAAPPPGPFDLTEGDLELMGSDPIAFTQLASTVVDQRVKWHQWNTYCQCSAVELPSTDCYWDVLETQAATAYWKLDEASPSNVAADAQGNGRNFTVHRGDRTRPGPMTGMACVGNPDLVWDTVDGIVRMSQNAFSTQVVNVTWTAWVMQRAGRTLQPHNLFMNMPNTAANGYQLLWNQSLGKAFSYYHAGVAVNNVGSPDYWDGTPAHEGWHHIAYRMLNGSCEIYIDGALFQAHTHSNPIAPVNGIMRLGTDWYGAIAAPAYWDRALTVQEIQDQYAARLGCETAPTPIDPLPAPELPEGLPTPPTAPVCSTDQLCIDVRAIQLQMSAVMETVRAIQRQAAPFAYQLVSTHAGLTGSGTLSVSGILALSVDFTTIPGYKGQRGSAIVDRFQLGFISYGTADGMVERVILRHDPQLIEGIPGYATTVKYDLDAGVVATVKTLRRLI